MENKYRLSIIVPVYNVCCYLENCLKSLVNQEIENYEIILVNDGSTDNSQIIMDTYQSKYSALIKCYKKENGGLSDARNFGVARASGEYLAFVDSDDFVDTDLFRKALKTAEERDLDIVAFDFIIEQNGKKRVKKTVNDDQDKYSIFRSSVNACNKMISRELWVENNLLFPVGIWYEDLAIIPTLPTLTEKIGFVENTYYHYVNRKGSITQQMKYNNKMLDIIVSLKNLEKHIKSNDNEMYLEFLFINHGLYLSTQNFIKYNKRIDLCKVIEFVTSRYPSWERNLYLCELPLLKRVYLWCLSHEMYGICRCLVMLRNKSGC